MKDELHGHAKWLKELGFITALKFYHKNDVPEKNAKGYKTPLFLLKYPNPITAAEIPVESLYTMGSYIADKLNAVKSFYDNKTFCHKENLFFGSPDDVWADTIGTVDAWKELCWHHPLAEMDWYDNNQNDLHLYFKEGELPMEFAELIGAPPEEVREAERAMYWEKIKKAEMTIAEQRLLEEKKMPAKETNDNSSASKESVTEEAALPGNADGSGKENEDPEQEEPEHEDPQNDGPESAEYRGAPFTQMED